MASIENILLHCTVLFLSMVEISAYEISRFSENFKTSCSCVIKTIQPQAAATVDDLRRIVSRVNSFEEGCISPWDDENIPEEIVSVEPNPG